MGFKKKYLLLVFIPTLLVFSYWFKIQMGVNFFDSYGISSYFPFKYFNNKVIVAPKPGILISENYNNKIIFKTWSDLWMRKDGAVTEELSSNGYNGSRCLLIKSRSVGSWTYSHKTIIQVKRGDRYFFEGLVKIIGDNLSASLSVAAFDSKKRVIDWNLKTEKVDKTGLWIKIAKQFTINDDNIKYIKFRLAGRGFGEYLFDHITLNKLK